MKTRTFIKNEIQRHLQEIKQLNDDLRKLSVDDHMEGNHHIKYPRSPPIMKPKHHAQSPFLIGDSVVITNNYKSKKGIKGHVTKSIGSYTFLEDRYGVIHQRAHHNLSISLRH